MKPIQKYIILIIGLSLFLLLGYIGFQNNDSSQLDESLDTETNTNPHINTGANNIPKPTTLSDSGNVWGGNPFQTGTANTGELTKPETPRLEFKKPNTEWKTRSLSGITYVFGEGNPKEVALPESEMIACNRQDDAPCNDNGAGYVDPILEKLVYDLLTSPDWVPLLHNCEQEYRIVDNFMQQQTNPPYPITYNTVVRLGQYISLEEVFIVNPQTGRKNITKEGYGKLMGLYGYIQKSSDTFNNGGLGNPLLGITKCVDIYGINIANKLANIRWLPWRGSKDKPESQGGWDGKLLPFDQSF